MERTKRLMSMLQARGLDAALIHRPENVRYLTGFTGEGSVFVCGDDVTVITDFRYVEQLSRQAPKAKLAQTMAGHREADCVLELTEVNKVRQMAVETDYISHDDFMALQEKLRFVRLLSENGMVEELRLVKDADEIESIRRSAAIASQAFANILDRLHVGMTEREAQIMLDYEMLALGSESNAFDTIAAAGVNGSLPHAIPSEHVIQMGEMLTLDFGAKVNGYCSDMTRTVAFGKLSPQLKEIYDLVYDAHMASLEAVRPGVTCGYLDKIARDMIDARFPGAFGHSLGHGVGLFIHEQPRVASGCETVLVPGHVITIEPGVYIPGVGGCRIEDMAILTSEGYIDPVTAPKQLIEL